jgi:pimeloyl-ACP methyl ester carboxylesterase
LSILLLTFTMPGCIGNGHSKHQPVHYGQIGLSDSVAFGVKLTYPTGKETDLLAIYVQPSMSKKDTAFYERDSISFNYKLKQRFLKSGISWMDVYSRKDSVAYLNSTCYSKADDIALAIEYVKNKLRLDRRIILVGQSEGGITSAIVSSARKDISGVILLSTPGVQGSQFLHYQDSLALRRFALTYGSNEQVWPFIFNLSPALGKTYSADTAGIQAYYQDLAAPLHRIMDRHSNVDSIRGACMLYLQECWNENKDKILGNMAKADSSRRFGFVDFLKSYRHKMYTMPQQIALYKWDPALYFPKIKCPVMAVFGTSDDKIEYSGSLRNMEILLKKGRNTNFKTHVLNGYSHTLQPSSRETTASLQHNVINEVVQWTLKLPDSQ